VKKELKPAIAIAPDNFLEPEKNLDKLFQFMDRCRGEAYIMGVPHGNDFTEYSDNYKQMIGLVDAIGISVHKFLPRLDLVWNLIRDKVIDQDKPHHLLGCKLPQEFWPFNRFDFIKTLDTSNPIIHGFYGIKYTENGLSYKMKENIDTIIESNPNSVQKANIYYNAFMFKSLLNGN
jgi:hypothetical protein